MNREHQSSSNRFCDAPRDRPHREGSEHANLERPGAQAHPRACWRQRAVMERAQAWRAA